MPCRRTSPSIRLGAGLARLVAERRGVALIEDKAIPVEMRTHVIEARDEEAKNLDREEKVHCKLRRHGTLRKSFRPSPNRRVSP
jgi:hypothetical protein